jgi:hypothetical protein
MSLIGYIRGDGQSPHKEITMILDNKKLAPLDVQYFFSGLYSNFSHIYLVLFLAYSYAFPERITWNDKSQKEHLTYQYIGQYLTKTDYLGCDQILLHCIKKCGVDISSYLTSYSKDDIITGEVNPFMTIIDSVQEKLSKTIHTSVGCVTRDQLDKSPSAYQIKLGEVYCDGRFPYPANSTTKSMLDNKYQCTRSKRIKPEGFKFSIPIKTVPATSFPITPYYGPTVPVAYAPSAYSTRYSRSSEWERPPPYSTTDLTQSAEELSQSISTMGEPNTTTMNKLDELMQSINSDLLPYLADKPEVISVMIFYYTIINYTVMLQEIGRLTFNNMELEFWDFDLNDAFTYLKQNRYIDIKTLRKIIFDENLADIYTSWAEEEIDDICVPIETAGNVIKEYMAHAKAMQEGLQKNSPYWNFLEEYISAINSKKRQWITKKQSILEFSRRIYQRN